MAVEILMLANDGEAGREKGAIIDIKECPEGGKVKWGSAECPPFFKLVRIDGVMKADLDPETLEFGGHRSRMVLDDTKLDKAHKDDLDAGKKPVVTHQKAKAALKDKGKDWMPTVAVEAIEDVKTK